jgi:hypothetical protein
MGLLKRILNFVASLFGRAKHGAAKPLTSMVMDPSILPMLRQQGE